MFQQGAEPGESGRHGVDVDRRGEVAADDEVGAFAAADLVGDHAADDRGVFLVGNVETGVREGDVCVGERREHLVARGGLVRSDHQAAQRCGVIVAFEPALDDLTEGDEGEHLLRCTIGVVEGDVGQQRDVDDAAGQHLDARVVARDEGERRTAGDRGFEARGE